jgi:hypothetical protein
MTVLRYVVLPRYTPLLSFGWALFLFLRLPLLDFLPIPSYNSSHKHMYLYLLIMKESFVSFCFVVEKKIIYEPRTSSSHQDSDQDEKIALPKDAVEKCSRLGCPTH